MTTPTGNFALTLYNLETLIAESSTFRTSVGASSTEEARARIHWPGYDFPNPSAIQRPFAWIRLDTGHEAVSEHTGGGGFSHHMPLEILFEASYDVTDTAKEAEIKFWNWVGGILSDMETLANDDTHLMVHTFVLREIARSDPKEDDRYFQAIVAVEVQA